MGMGKQPKESEKVVVVKLTEADAQDILAGFVPQSAIEEIRRALAEHQSKRLT